MTASHDRVVAVIAARDEVDRIAATVAALRAFVDRVVVADDGSSDGTGAAAASAGAAVTRRARSVGKGGALESALERVGDADIVLLADGDLGESAASLATLLGPIRSGSADLAVGILPAGPGGGFGLVRRLSAALVRASGGPRMSAPMSGQRALTAAALAALRPFASGFGVETAMDIDAVRAGLRVVEVPVTASHRARGRSLAGFAHRARQGLHVLLAAVPRIIRARRATRASAAR